MALPALECVAHAQVNDLETLRAVLVNRAVPVVRDLALQEPAQLRRAVLMILAALRGMHQVVVHLGLRDGGDARDGLCVLERIRLWGRRAVPKRLYPRSGRRTIPERLHVCRGGRMMGSQHDWDCW